MSDVILLNGASSSGKSTLAQALRETLPSPFWHVSSDQFVEAGFLPPVREQSGPFSWAETRPRFFRAFHRCLPAIASAGNNLIVEHVIEHDTWFVELVDLLQAHDVFFVGVHCDPGELARREAARGDRRPGEAIAHLNDGVHRRGPYDFEVDTTDANMPDRARAISAAWETRRGPSAFERFRAV